MKKKQYELFKKLKEDDIPICKIKGKEKTAKEIYKEKKKVPLTLRPDWDLIEKRLETKLKKGMVNDIYRVKGKVTADEQLREVKDRTSDGYEYMLAEQKLLEWLLAYDN